MDALVPSIPPPPILCTYTHSLISASSILCVLALSPEQTYLDIGSGTSSHHVEAVLVMSYTEALMLLRIHWSTVQSSDCSGIKDDLRTCCGM